MSTNLNDAMSRFFNGSIPLTDPGYQSGGYVTVATAGFVNPTYVTNNGNVSTTDITGFDISDCCGYIVSFENGSTLTLTHQQSLDPAGAAASWFSVGGTIATGTSAVSATSGGSGSAYFFPGYGSRARINITACTVADARIRITKVYDLNLAFGAQTISTLTPGTSAANLGKAEDAASASGDTGVFVLPIRRDALASNASAAGDYSEFVVSSGAQLIQKPYSPNGSDWTYAAATGGIVNSTTAVTIKTAGGAGLRNYVTGLQISTDTLGAATELAIRDGAAGTVIWRTKLQTTPLPVTLIEFPTPLFGTAATLLEIVTLTASVTGGVYVSAQGYVGP